MASGAPPSWVSIWLTWPWMSVKLIINHSMMFDVLIEHLGTISMEKFVLVKINGNELITYNIGFTDNFTPVSLSLEAGIYYIGFFNKMNNDYVYTTFYRKLLSQYNNSMIITDPSEYDLVGSQINVLESASFSKSYRQNYITENFTRLLYLDFSSISISRLDYYWYSSDESKAIVTNYGTVFAKEAGYVDIVAVYKYDYSIAYIKTIQVIQDEGNNIINIYNDYYVEYDELNSGCFLIHLEEIICPFPMFSYYTWSLTPNNNYSVSYEGNGIFLVTQRGSFVLCGTYLLSNRLIYIFINVYVV